MIRRGLAALAMLAVAAVASASPDGAVDRERLQKAAQLPSVGPNGWYYSVTTDGRVFAGGEAPQDCDVATLRARIKGDDADAERWMDVAAACRRQHDAAGEQEGVEKAAEILRRRVKASPDDGRALASLGLALDALGDEAGADEAIEKASHAPLAAWAGVAATVDRHVTGAVGRAAEHHFATLDDALTWLGANSAKGALVDRAVLEEAAKKYDEAAADVERSGATGPAAAAVYLGRRYLRSLSHETGPKPETDEATARIVASGSADMRRAMMALSSDPYALTLAALGDAMSEPAAPDWVSHVLPFAELSETAHANLGRDLGALNKLAAGADAATAARALQGIACVQWFSMRDANVTVALLGKSVLKDPMLRASWSAAAFVYSQVKLWDELATACRAWVKVDDTALHRMMLAKALSLGGHAADAEKEWRAAQVLDPTGLESNYGVAVLVLQRAKDDADVKEAREFLGRAAAAAKRRWGDDGEMTLVDLADAVARGLSGDLDGAEKIARRILAQEPMAHPAREVLAAIGR